MTGLLGHAQRADAQRNHQLLLDAAARLFAERGSDVSAEDIARSAGVAKGTLFRHFPTKEHLRSAVLADRLAQLRVLVGALAVEPQPGLATIAELMTTAATVLAADRSFFDAATCSAPGDPVVEREKQALDRELNALLVRAQQSGEVRDDIAASDIGLLIMAATNTCAPCEQRSPDLWRRFIALMIDALRAGETTPLPVPPLRPAVAPPRA
jgi:AcrR family transcriptional regulator